MKSVVGHRMEVSLSKRFDFKGFLSSALVWIFKLRNIGTHPKIICTWILRSTSVPDTMVLLLDTWMLTSSRYT